MFPPEEQQAIRGGHPPGVGRLGQGRSLSGVRKGLPALCCPWLLVDLRQVLCLCLSWVTAGSWAGGCLCTAPVRVSCCTRGVLRGWPWVQGRGRPALSKAPTCVICGVTWSPGTSHTLTSGCWGQKWDTEMRAAESCPGEPLVSLGRQAGSSEAQTLTRGAHMTGPGRLQGTPRALSSGQQPSPSSCHGLSLRPGQDLRDGTA